MPDVRAALAMVAVVLLVAVPGAAQSPRSEARNMRLLGHHDLQARPAYQPVIHRQGERFIAYVGHHGGVQPNPLTGVDEPSGTSILDVTDPRAPRYLAHIPGAPGGASMVRVCGGRTLPRADPAKTYLLRTLGDTAHEVWDVSDPARPAPLTTVLAGLGHTHKNWWECDSGIAYLVSDGRPAGWRTHRMTKIYDLGDPARPRFIRDFGLAGQEPGSTGPAPEGVHGPIALRNRVYFAYGTGARGVLQIVDRARLLAGDPRLPAPFAPAAANLAYPEVGRLDLPPDWGVHTSFPVLGITVADFLPNSKGAVRDFVVLVSESLRDECQEVRQLTFLVDVTTESRPMPVSTFQVPAGDFCERGGRFGPHASNESFAPIYYGKVVFIAYFNAGVRAVDIRDPFRPREVGYFIPAVTPSTERRCVTVRGALRCRAAIQTNNVEIDDRGLVYLTDRASTGLHIVEPTGPARGGS